MGKWLILGLLVAGGCSSELETGYQPRKLAASDGDRRAYYATPFSPGSKAGAEDNAQSFDARRPIHP